MEHPFLGSSTFVRSLKFKIFLAEDKDSGTALGSSWILKTGPENLGRASKLVHWPIHIGFKYVLGVHYFTLSLHTLRHSLVILFSLQQIIMQPLLSHG